MTTTGFVQIVPNRHYMQYLWIKTLRKSKSYFSLLEPRTVDFEKHSINLKCQINNKVDNSGFDDMINESKKKLETFESNL